DVLLSVGHLNCDQHRAHALDDVVPPLTVAEREPSRHRARGGRSQGLGPRDKLKMTINPDPWIRRMARDHKMIEPFVETQVRGSAISYGVSSYGYDIRGADEFKVFTNINNTVIDPKNFDPRSFVDVKTDVCIVPPNSFA